jgi:FKBP-type peptidyl-prolyl cis-trans isomerase
VQARADDKVVPKAKVGVTPGGVKYFDKESGSCSPFNPCVPQAGDIVKIKYKAYLSNGSMFDSSDGPGRKPLAAKFKASPPQLLPGWEEALETMEQGSTRVIQVPPRLAYGDKGVKVETKDGGSEYLVPPNETLQFELTLVQVALPPP